MSHELIRFENKALRKIWHEGEWYFSVVDVIEVLTDSPIPRNYWNILKKREPQLHTICMQLKLTAQDGRMRLTDCANTEGVFRIIMSVPSQKAEPFKQWLAQVGKERIDETENPELTLQRVIDNYKAKGYSDEWIANRIKTIETRKELTDEWKARGVKESKDFSILTATIAKGTFGVTPSEHSKIKGLERENLRDHMTPLELIFTALSEEITRKLSIKEDAQGFAENHETAQEGGQITGRFRQETEAKLGEKVVSSQNFLNLNKTEELSNDEL
jgi:DNA-damage-inducible protein D